ncbi:MAG: alpha/beta hydrolase domain-containing protein [Acidobacteriota bacterium]
MPGSIRIAAIAIAIVCPVAVTQARVTRIEIVKVESPAPAGRGGTAAGAYERLTGKAHGELDPNDPKNAVITDLRLAPRNARGKVEYVATFSLMKPIDMTQSSGVLMYSVVNRGTGTAAAGADGHVSLVSGWQGDLVATASNQTIQVPVARNPDGSSITGPLVLRFTGLTGTTAALTIPRNQPSPYPPMTLDTSKAALVSAVAESALGVKTGTVALAAGDWAFADCTATAFPGKPDATRICARNGFNPALLYELQYTAKDPLVLGIGAAATRDINSFFRYEKQDDAGTANPVADRIRWGISEGTSQSGTFLRLFIQLGFNQDEQGRRVWDGSNPHIASRVIDLNRRFAMPGGTVSLYELGMEAPLWWEDWDDTARGRGRAGLLDRCRASNTCPKIMETFGSAEIWGLRASSMLVGTTATADIPLPDNVRRYYFPGVTHGGGPGGFETTTGPVAGGCDLPVNPAPVAPMRSALLSALTGWVTKGTPMPASRYPTIGDGTLVADTKAAMGYPAIPGQPAPENLVYPFLDYDLGSGFGYRDQSGALTRIPTVKRALPQLVPKVDADGNETAGVKSPLQMAPLGTYTGWNVMSSGPFKGQMCLFASPVGGFIPFAKTKAARLTAGDPRLSLEERYRTHAGYVQALTAATRSLVKDGYLRQADADAMVKQAEASGVLTDGN